jgi:DNA polymerase-3 subunit delta'
MSLSEIFCQDKPIESLQRAYAAGRMAHAYLFSGDDGVGKLTTAQAWAKMLLCENKQTIRKDSAFIDSCGACHSCRTFDGGGHPDFRLLSKEMIQYTREGKNKTTPVKFPIDVIREFFIEKVANRPTMGQFVVYVIDEFEKVSDEAQNALLKTLEEPPRYCVIILLCSRLDKMLPTTLSRCQLVRFGPVEEARIIKQLAAEGVSKKEAIFWARFSEGSMGRALGWAQLQIEDEPSPFGLKKELLEKFVSLELADVVDTAEWVGQTAKKIASAWSSRAGNVSATDISRRAQKGLIQMASCAFSDVIKMVYESGGLVNEDQAGRIEALSRKFDAETAARQVQMCYRMQKWVDSSVNEKLIFEQLLLNLVNSSILNSF